MQDIPLHPAIVHVPIGLAVVLPLLAIAIAVAVWRGKLPRWTFAFVLGLQAVVLGGGLLAMNTGEQDEERVEEVVPESAIEEHEEAAEAFVWATGVTLAVSVVALLLPAGAARWGIALATAATIAVAGLAVRTGHAGGKLVYEHGAASAHTGASGPAGGEPRPDVAGEGLAEHAEDERDD